MDWKPTGRFRIRAGWFGPVLQIEVITTIGSQVTAGKWRKATNDDLNRPVVWRMMVSAQQAAYAQVRSENNVMTPTDPQVRAVSEADEHRRME